MTDAKRLLAEAMPLPWAWEPSTFTMVRDEGGELVASQGWHIAPGPDDAALIVYAVNHLPDYLAAVEALERLAELAGPETNEPEWSGNWRVAWRYARVALAHLRDGVSA